MKAKKQEFDMLEYFRVFQRDMRRNKRLQANGKRIKLSTQRNYESLHKLLVLFSEKESMQLRLRIITKMNSNQIKKESLYWKDFYFRFTKFLYDDLGNYDNYVGRLIKLLRSFFNYLIIDRHMNIGQFHKKFHCALQDVEIHALSSERLELMILDQEIRKNMPKHLIKFLDLFLFGCSVALRYSDLMTLRKENIEWVGEIAYLKTISRKSQTFTRVRLPEFALEILKRYITRNRSSLFPKYCMSSFNNGIKVVMAIYGFTEPIYRYRTRRGIPFSINKQRKKNILRFCDIASSHMMRRTAITHLLRMKVPENIVRQVSGHAPGGKDFYRYISFSQPYMDQEILKAYVNLDNKNA